MWQKQEVPTPQLNQNKSQIKAATITSALLESMVSSLNENYKLFPTAFSAILFFIMIGFNLDTQ